jgi:hypothetical protein
MKIIMVDNFNREGPGHDDKLIAMTQESFWGKIIVTLLNAQYDKDPNNPDFFKLVEDDHKLQEFKP